MSQITEQTADYQLADLSPVLKAANSGNTLLESLPVWLNAQTRKSAGRGRSANNTLQYGVQKLRELILELAIQGKLVPQDPNDETASILLEKITEEKVRLVKEGKIKKQKLITDSNSSTLNDQLPKNWTNEFLGNFAYIEMGQSPASKYYNQSGEGMPFFQGKADFNDTYPTVRYWCVEPSKQSYPGDVLLSVRAPVGPTNIANIECCIGRGLAALRPLGSTPTNFLRILIKASEHDLKARATGTTFSAVSKSDIETILVPVPPLAEQHRIVKKVDELMALCDQLEQQQADALQAHDTLVKVLLDTLTQSESAEDFQQNWRRIAEYFDTLFTTESSIEQLKQTLLQLAVMGKLVPQDSNDEPASILLDKITKEKAQLVKDGKIKTPKNLPSIAKEEQPFSLPTSWLWSRMGSALNKITDGTHHSPSNSERGDFMYVSAKNIKTEGVQTVGITYVTKEVHQEIYNRCNPEFGDILYIKDGATTGIATINQLNTPFSMLSSVALVKCGKHIVNEYLLICLRAPFFYEEMRAGMTGVAITRVTLKKLDMAIIPIPPLAEQHRIVKKVDELMGLCDKLKDRLNQAQILQKQIAETVVKQTLK